MTLSAFAGLWACTSPTPTSLSRPIPEDDIVLVTTTDLHSNLDDAEGIANTIDLLRARYGEKMIYADAGDQFQGSLEGDLDKGATDVLFFNALKLDVAAIGNHELDFGPRGGGLRIVPRAGEDPVGNLRERVAQAKYSWLSANWIMDSPKKSKFKNALGDTTLFAPHVIFEKVGKKICFIGATTPETQTKSLPEHLRNTHFSALAPVVQAEAIELRTKERCDFVILVVHAGVICGTAKPDPTNCLERAPHAEVPDLLEELPEKTLDAVIAGHTHVRAQVVIHGIPVIEAGAYGRTVGILHLTKNEFRFDPFIDVPASSEKNEKISLLLKAARDRAAKLKSENVGTLDGTFTRDMPHDYQNENPFADFLSDSYVDYARTRGYSKIQFGVVQAGQIRAPLPNGPVTYGSLAKSFPFTNRPSVVRLSGKELRIFLATAVGGKFGVAAIAGLRVHVTKPDEKNNRRLLAVEDSRGRRIQDRVLYDVVTTEYLAGGGDDQGELFSRVPKRRIHVFENGFPRDVVAASFRVKKVVRAVDYGKIPRVVSE